MSRRTADQYTEDLHQQAAEAKLHKQRQQLFEKAQNLREMSQQGAEPGFLRDQESRLLVEARALGMDARDLLHGPEAPRQQQQGRPRPQPVDTNNNQQPADPRRQPLQGPPSPSRTKPMFAPELFGNTGQGPPADQNAIKTKRDEVRGQAPDACRSRAAVEVEVVNKTARLRRRSRCSSSSRRRKSRRHSSSAVM